MDNAHPDCPAKMSDQRFATNYLPRCLQEISIVDERQQPLSSYAYRQYLINNAETLIRQQGNDFNTKYGCRPCSGNTELAAQRVQVCNGRTCKFTPPDYSGLGLERK